MKKLTANLRAHQRLYGALGVGLLAGLAGSYLLFGVQAASTCGTFYSEEECDVFAGKFPPGEIFSYFEEWPDGTVPANDWSKGDRIGLQVRASFSVDFGSPTQIIVLLTSDPGRVKYLGYTCGTAGSCSNSGWSKKLPPYVYPNKDAVVCIDVAPGTYERVKLFTVYYKAEKRLSVLSIQSGPQQWNAYRAAYASGTCATNKTAVGSMFGSYKASEGVCGIKGFSLCVNGAGPGNPKPGNVADGGRGDGNEGDGIGDGPGGGGGSGGSSANQQDDQPNPLPSSSPQGDRDKQPEIEPSPFYDGKQYEPGSDPDGELGIVAATGKTVADNWPYILGGTVIIGAVGAGGYWWWKRR